MPRIISREWGGRGMKSGWQFLRMGGGAGLMGENGGGREGEGVVVLLQKILYTE